MSNHSIDVSLRKTRKYIGTNGDGLCTMVMQIQCNTILLLVWLAAVFHSLLFHIQLVFHKHLRG